MPTLFYSPDAGHRELVGLTLRDQIEITGDKTTLTEKLRGGKHTVILHVLSTGDSLLGETASNTDIKFVGLSGKGLESLGSQFYPFETNSFVTTISRLVTN